jgi:hypothetical protein
MLRAATPVRLHGRLNSNVGRHEAALFARPLPADRRCKSAGSATRSRDHDQAATAVLRGHLQSDGRLYRPVDALGRDPARRNSQIRTYTLATKPVSLFVRGPSSLAGALPSRTRPSADPVNSCSFPRACRIRPSISARPTLLVPLSRATTLRNKTRSSHTRPVAPPACGPTLRTIRAGAA